MITDEMLTEWKRLEDAFHDNLPNQGECGDPAHGKALCQFLYDNSETIRAAMSTASQPPAEDAVRRAIERSERHTKNVLLEDPSCTRTCILIDDFRTIVAALSFVPKDSVFQPSTEDAVERARSRVLAWLEIIQSGASDRLKYRRSIPVADIETIARVQALSKDEGRDWRKLAGELCRAMKVDVGQITLNWAEMFLRDKFDAAHREDEARKWHPHLDYSGEPMKPGEFRDPPTDEGLLKEKDNSNTE